eukprot:8566654-Lingulodinium_polyedra.AAC.1
MQLKLGCFDSPSTAVCSLIGEDIRWPRENLMIHEEKKTIVYSFPESMGLNEDNAALTALCDAMLCAGALPGNKA